MEVLVILLLIVLIFLIVSFRTRALQRIDQLEGEVRRMRQEFNRTGGPSVTPAPVVAPPAAPITPTPPIPAETEDFIPPSRKEPAPIRQEFQPPPAITKPHSFQPASALSAAESTADSPAPGFFEKHPDLEKFIGENLVSKIGIAILVLAIGFFVKYAIDNEWIGPIGRVGVGLICGGILTGIAHVMRNSYKAFSSVLVGGGLAVFYFTIALAYHQYHLFGPSGQSVAFVIMLVITAFAVILSILYDRQELAIISLVGGFVTPFLVSNGSSNYRVLFSYLLILNTGLLVIAYRKAWRLLNLLAFGFTAILFTSWLITRPYDETTSTFRGGFLFATTFYILFFIINIAYNIRENKKFIASDFGILLANTCLYFAAGLYMIAAMGMVKYQGLFSACMGVFNLCGSYFLFRTKKVDSNILYLLIGITLTFISLTAPIQLHGHYITLFWASEAVLLYWLSRKSGIRVIGVASLVVWVAMLVSLVMDWAAVYGNVATPLPVIFNKGLMTSFYSALCCIALFLLRKGAAAGEDPLKAGDRSGMNKLADNVVIITGCLLLFAGGALELYHQFNFYYPDSPLFTLYFVLYGFLWSSFISYAGNRWHWFGHYSYATGLLAISIAFYLVLTPAIYDIQVGLLGSGRYVAHFAAHWVSALLVALMIARLITWWRQEKTEPVIPPDAFTWIICAVIVIFLSAEIELLVNHLFYSKTDPFSVISRVYHKAGLAILWGLCSFIFMWLGMRNKFKPLRIVSLFLFSLTLCKLFLYDIRNIPIAGKIAAFFCLGVLLLVVSFMYQRLKKIIIEDEEKKTV